MANNHGLPTLGGEDISPDNPRLLVDRDGNRARSTDPIEYHSLTTGHGMRDITGTDESGQPAEQQPAPQAPAGGGRANKTTQGGGASPSGAGTGAPSGESGGTA